MEKSLYSKVFMWMGIGLLITFSTGYLVSNSENMLSSVFSPMSMILLIVLEFAAVIIQQRDAYIAARKETVRQNPDSKAGGLFALPTDEVALGRTLKLIEAMLKTL